MKILVTGATGFIGRSIVPFLRLNNYELLLVGRSVDKLKSLFPGLETTNYENLSNSIKNVDAVVHLAAKNNDSEGTLDEFRTVNVELTTRIATIALENDVPLFLNFASLRSSDVKNTDPYTQSKLEGELALSKIEGMKVINLRLPAVYGDTYQGKLAVLNKVPKFVQKPLFWLLAALKPTVNVMRVCEELDAVLKNSNSISADHIISDEQIHNPVYHWSKRLVDLGFAVFVVVFLWWLLIIAGIAIRLNSPGPILFRQKRVGYEGKVFECFKFRSMAKGTKQVGTHEVNADAITSIGKFLRRSKIDELPQIWNIFKNEISLVGPRPCLPIQDDVVSEREMQGVFRAKPGITGLAQIRDIDMSQPKLLAQIDAEYIQTRSILADLKIIIGTVLGNGQGDRVVAQSVSATTTDSKETPKS